MSLKPHLYKISLASIFCFAIFPLMLSIGSLPVTATSESTSAGTSVPVENPIAADSYDLSYYFSLYRVNLTIEGRDIHAKIDMTYEITRGTKTGGFKRFQTPAMAQGSILEDSIVVKDGATILSSNYREFTGKDDSSYKEISFSAPAFNGTKTITMEFTMKDWIIETRSESVIELNNFGTFSVPVTQSEYLIVFPEGFTPSSVNAHKSGTIKLDEIDGRVVYSHLSSGSSEDPVFSFTPKVQDYISVFWIVAIVPIPIIIVFLIFLKKRAKSRKFPEILIRELENLTPEEAARVYYLLDKSDPKTTARVLQIAIAALHTKHYIDITEDKIGRAKKTPPPEELPTVEGYLYDLIPLEPENIESFVKNQRGALLRLEESVDNKLVEQGIFYNAKTEKTWLIIWMLFPWVFLIVIAIVGYTESVFDMAFGGQLFFVYLLVFLGILAAGQNMGLLRKLTPTAYGLETRKLVREWIKELRAQVEVDVARAEKSNILIQEVESKLPYLAIGQSNHQLQSWVKGLQNINPVLLGVETAAFVSLAGIAALSSVVFFDSSWLVPPRPSGGGGGGCSSCGGGCGGLDTGKGISRCQAKIIVSVNRHGHILAHPGCVLHDPRDQGTEFLRRGVANRIRDIERSRPGFDGRGQHLVQEFRVRTSGIFRAELHIITIGAGIGNHRPNLVDDLLAGHVEFVLHMDFGSCQKGMDTRVLRAANGFPGFVDIAFYGPCQTTDYRNFGLWVTGRRVTNFIGNPTDRLQVVR